MKQLLYPIGQQSFKDLREGGFIYIDKTDLIHKLITEGKYYFLSRPRRFGKSLLLSTIEAYFKGERQLFKGLAIDSLTDKWDFHEVLHLDLNNDEYTKPEHLQFLVNNALTKWERIYGSDTVEKSIASRFAGIIERAYKKSNRKVVILVDEYDKPLTEAILDEQLSESYKNTLKALYSNFKTCDKYIQFVMLTGVSRFAGVSVFSGENLEDITNDRDFETICGITEKEMIDNLEIGVHNIAATYGWSFTETMANLRKWYDGYQFSDEQCDVYNPFSLLNAMKKRKLGFYWHNTGTPSFLLKLMLKGRFPVSTLLNIRDASMSISMIQNASKTNLVSLMLQTGYLTIDTLSPFGQCTLRFPNHEVQQSFLEHLFMAMAESEGSSIPFDAAQFKRLVDEGDADAFMDKLKGLTSRINYHPKTNSEDLFQDFVGLFFTLFGMAASLETHVASGRSDMTLETSRYAYVFEFKVNSTPEAALDQINQKGYADIFKGTGKQVIKVGANFDSESRSITNWLIETMP